MRRKDREITDLKEIETIIKNCKIFHLALFDDEYPYVLSMHYGYEFVDGCLTLYAHCAKSGHKLDLIRKNNHVCIEIDNDITLVSGCDVACEYGSTYSSIIARGTIEIVEDANLKKHALSNLMKHQTNRKFTFDDKMIQAVEVLCFQSINLSCKARKK